MKKRILSLALAVLLLVAVLPSAVFAAEKTVTDIYTAEDFIAFTDAVNAGCDYKGKTVKLHTDALTVETPVGTQAHPFAGTFDGAGHEVELFIGGEENVGLFGYLKGATVKNVRVSGSIVGTKNVGAVAGAMEAGMIYGCESSCAVSTVRNAGGIVGAAISGSGHNYVTSCVNDGCVTAGYNIMDVQREGGAAGGILGEGSGVTISLCKNYGDVTTQTSYVGGIVGHALGGFCAVLRSKNAGELFGYSYKGALVGGAEKSTRLWIAS